MERTLIKNVKPGTVCKIQGFVENFRNKRTMAFLVLRDLTGKMQVTIAKEEHPEMAEELDKITLESVVTVVGEVVANEYVKLNGIEVLPNELKVESVAEALPIQDDAAIDLKMDYRWLDLRSEKNQLMFKVQTLAMQSLRNFLIEKDFLEIHSPKLISTASESGSDVFEVKYFDTKAYLAQSPQFYKQMAMASGFERIFECGPVFRAEKSHTNKHATEFTGFDLEVSYINSYKDLMDLEAEMLTYMLKNIKDKYGDEILRLYDKEIVVPTLPFPTIKLADLYEELKTRYGYEIPAEEMGDLTTDAERLCKKFAQEKYGHQFLFVTDYSAEKRAFYHMRDEAGVPLGYDLIWNGVEITTGAQREHRYEKLKAQAQEKGLDRDVKHYLEFFKYGCPPHGGFGVGLDRLTMMIFDLSIKEVMFLFRGPNRLNP
ncbi:MAG: aspartate--tRNA(Asn) ligase [Clostridiales bacterium]|nr:aspartate--tRNA(Asn) ligase [Clostridiales bacterium]